MTKTHNITVLDVNKLDHREVVDPTRKWYVCPFQSRERHLAYSNIQHGVSLQPLFCPFCAQFAWIAETEEEAKYWKALLKWRHLDSSTLSLDEAWKAYNNGCPFDVLADSRHVEELQKRITRHRAKGKATSNRARGPVYQDL